MCKAQNKQVVPIPKQKPSDAPTRNIILSSTILFSF